MSTKPAQEYGALCAQIEGTCSGRYGFIIAVTDILNTGKGTIREGTGSANFNVQYMCLVFRPFRGEVIDCVVSSVNKVFDPAPLDTTCVAGISGATHVREERSSACAQG